MTSTIAPTPFESIELAEQLIEIKAPMDLMGVAKAMNRRFSGLPTFHRSVRLEMVDICYAIENEADQLAVGAECTGRLAGANLAALSRLIGYVNERRGTKSLTLLHLNVRLNPAFAATHFERRLGHRHPIARRILRSIAASTRVPVMLAVASNLHPNLYESYAVSLRGVTRYASALTIRRSTRESALLARGGLIVAVEARDIDHWLSKWAGHAGIPERFFDDYLIEYLLPERGDIFGRLCRHVCDTIEGERRPRPV